MANILALVSQKGGVGKSTLARALAREAAAATFGRSWPTSTCSKALRPTGIAGGLRRVPIRPSPSKGLRLPHKPFRLPQSFDYLIIDGPARARAATLEIARATSLVIQPTGASADDLHPAVLLFHELVRERVPCDRLVFALCRIGTDAEEGEARAYLTQAGYDVLPGFVPERPAYRQGAKPWTDDHRDAVLPTQPSR